MALLSKKAPAPQSVETITAGLSTMVENLRQHSSQTASKAADRRVQAAKLNTAADEDEAEANRALNVAEKIAGLLA